MKKISIVINADDRLGHISPEIYGHFSEHLGRCIYNGIYVGENSPISNTDGIRNDIIEAFRNIKAPVFRWPGGCFAEEYHWQDGIGEKALRRKIVNTNWGGVTEDNSFGTHEFMRFCELVGCKPYINVNVGSGSVREMSEWIEYMTSDAESLSQSRERRTAEPSRGNSNTSVSAMKTGAAEEICVPNITPTFIKGIRRFATIIRETDFTE